MTRAAFQTEGGVPNYICYRQQYVSLNWLLLLIPPPIDLCAKQQKCKDKKGCKKKVIGKKVCIYF